MKLLYCIPALCNAGGMERVITEKVNYLANHSDYNIFIVTTDQQNRAIRFRLDDKVQVIHLNIDFDSHFNKNLVSKYFSHKRKLHEYQIKLEGLINDLAIDICISLCGKEIEFLSKLEVSCKKIAEIHFSMNYRKQFLVARSSFFLWKIIGDLRTMQLISAVKKLDKLVVLTANDKSQWQNVGVDAINIPNSNPISPIDLNKLENKRAISIGRLDAQKGYDMLIDIWSAVSKKHPDWKLDIFGVGEWEQMLKDKIKANNLVGLVNLMGLTNNVENEYLNSSIYIMSSRYEGFGMVLIEAMSCGLPVVSFDCEYGPSEIITNNVDGFLVELSAIQIFADKICVLIENDMLRKEMGRNAMLSSKRFSKTPIMTKWIELFNTLK